MKRGNVPERGDFIWINFTPQAGREQAGRRPALVLSPAPYNDRTSLVVVCPITNRAKGYPFEVQVPKGAAVSGVVLADHLRSVDWRARRAEPAGKAPGDVLAEVSAKLRALLFL